MRRSARWLTELRSVALGKSAERLKPKNPSSRPSVSDASSAAASTKLPPRLARNRFEGFAVDDLLTQLLKHGRHKVRDKRHVAEVLDELISRARELHVRAFREGCFVANSSGLHSRCVELAQRRVRDTKQPVELYEAVVDSAWMTHNLTALAEVVAAAHPKLRPEAIDPVTEMAVFRALWRCGVALRRLESFVGRHKQPHGGPTPGAAASSPNSARSDDQKLRNAVNAARSIFAVLASANPDVAALIGEGPKEEAQERAFQKMMRQIKLTVMYSPLDSGEAAFYEMCFRKYLQCRHMKSSIVFTSLIRSCRHSVEPSRSLEYLKKYLENNSEAEEIVFVQLFHNLHASREFATICDVMRKLLSESEGGPNGPSLALIGLAIRAAGEIQDEALATRLFNEMISGRSATPSASDVFACLVGLAKCGVPSFPRILESCCSNKLIEGADEEIAFLRLQYALNVAGAEEVLRDVFADATSKVLSARVLTLVLQIQLRCESPNFLDSYKQFVHVQAAAANAEDSGVEDSEDGMKTGAADRHWIDLLVLWADRRRSQLTLAQRSYIANELRAHGVGGLDRRDPDGLRSRIALLLADERLSPLERFRRSGEVVPIAEYADPRCYFLASGRDVLKHSPVRLPSVVDRRSEPRGVLQYLLTDEFLRMVETNNASTKGSTADGDAS